MSSKKDKKRKKNGSKSEAGVDQVGDKASEEQLKRPEASERLSDLPRFQPKGNFFGDSAKCTLSLDSPDTEVCLIQLPFMWEVNGQGLLHLPSDDGQAYGHCRSEAGEEYHVLEEQTSRPSQIFAFAPGSNAPPRRVQRHYTLVRASNLDLERLTSAEQPKSIIGTAPTKGGEERPQASTIQPPKKSHKVKGEKRRHKSMDQTASETHKTGKKKRRKTLNADV